MTWLIYGANGYTGRLIAEAAVARGERPVLAGRSAAAVTELASQLGCSTSVFEANSADAALAELGRVRTVVNCAGPFSQTAHALATACVTRGIDYLDISGEVVELARVFSLDAAARAAGSVLIPGIGYAHSDCLCNSVASRVQHPVELSLAFRGFGSASRGTFRTALEDLARGGFLVRGARFVPAREAQERRVVPFASGARHAASVTWGDLAIAQRSTAIANITVFTELPRVLAWFSPLLGLLSALLRRVRVRRSIEWLAEGCVNGPPLRERAGERMEYWACARDGSGQTAELTMTTPNIYVLTVDAVLAAVQRLAQRDTPPGAHAPATAFGVDFIHSLPGVRLGSVAG
jgi:short subunit dehydrogenase-like uncharacterized protein